MVQEDSLSDVITILTAKEAARYLQVSLHRLKRIESEGGLISYRTPDRNCSLLYAVR